MARILITGASGQLGSYLLRELHERGTPATGWSGTQTGMPFGVALRPVDLCNPAAVTVAFHEARPDVVIHTAALSTLASCARAPALARAINGDGAALLAKLAAAAGARLLHVSTDLVFDGEQAPYREGDRCAPLSVYGRTKADAERLLRAWPGTAVVRISLLYGPSLTGRPTLFDQQCQALRAGQPLTLFDDEWRTPLDLPTAACALLAIAGSEYTGIWHVGGPERLSRLAMGQRLAQVLGCDARLVAVSRNAAGQQEPRPCDVSLDSSRWRGAFPAEPWPRFEDAVRSLLA